MKRGGRFIAVECKLTETPGPEALKGVVALARDYGVRAIEKAYVACRVRHRYTVSGDPAVEACGILDLVAALPGNG